MLKKLLLSVLASIALILAGCNDSPNESPTKAKKTKQTSTIMNSKCQLTMGWDPWAPYQYLTPDDKVAGLEIDLINALAKEANCSVKFVQKNWMSLLNDIRGGKIDMLGGASRTKAREKFALFSNNYRSESFVLYIRAGEQDKYRATTLKDLLETGFKLGVTQDYVYGAKVSELQANDKYQNNFVSVTTSEENYFNLTQKQVDGFLEDPFVAAYTLKRSNLQDKIEAHTIEVHSGDVSIMFSKRSVEPETVVAFNKALVKLKKNGEYQKILARYAR